MSFAIIISEKGGAERRELFDKTEVVVGRIQGNDLTLPKSNVSKKHAKLLFLQGRFVVIDNESTNGTYVNSRRIAKPTIVREGDKIYIGDFVLRCEAGPGSALAPESMVSAPGPREATLAELAQLSLNLPANSPREGISHYPLEHDPDEIPQVKVSIPAPPRLPSGLARPGGTQAIPTSPPLPQGPVTDQGSAVIHALAHAVVGPPAMGLPRPSPVRPPGTSLPSAPAPPRESAESSPRRTLLLLLLDALSERMDLEPLRAGTWPVDSSLVVRIEQHLQDLVSQFRQVGTIPEATDTNLLLQEAQRELIGLGPLATLLEDPEVTSIQIQRHNAILVQRGPGVSNIEPGFSSEAALQRVLARLCSQSGQARKPEEVQIERSLASWHLLAILPPLSSSSVLHLHRLQPEQPLEDPVRTGVISRGAWNFLQQSLTAHLGLLIVGPPQAFGFLAAMLPLLPPEERTALLLPSDLSLPIPPQGVLFRMDAPYSKGLLHQVTRMGFDRIVSLCDDDKALLEMLSRRTTAPLLFTSGTSAHQAITRIVAQSCVTHPGLLPKVAREWLTTCLDLLVEVVRLRDGRLRVSRIAEFDVDSEGRFSFRDLFLAITDRGGNGESHLTPTGVSPRFLEDLQSRGYAMDPSIFERISSR